MWLELELADGTISVGRAVLAREADEPPTSG